MSDNDNNAGNNPYAAPQSVIADAAPDTPLATRLERFLAALLDGLIMGCVTLIPAIVFFGGWMSYMGVAASHQFIFPVVSGVVGFGLFILINGVFLARDGQTIGKKAMGIKIVRTDGSKADFARIIVWRQAPIWVAQAIPFIGSVLGLIDVLLIFRDSRRCIHDDIADTKVIKA
ncbi:MAG TPA: RDD family protein [Burkholderiaceae bacterium]